MVRVVQPDCLHFGPVNGLHLFGELVRYPSLERLLRTPVPAGLDSESSSSTGVADATSVIGTDGLAAMPG
jgi:hypothetical protein